MTPDEEDELINLGIDAAWSILRLERASTKTAGTLPVESKVLLMATLVILLSRIGSPI